MKISEETAKPHENRRISLVYNESSTSIFIRCACGREFSKTGAQARELSRQWKASHPCALRPQEPVVTP